jgi:benzodiazapine receptor
LHFVFSVFVLVQAIRKKVPWLVALPFAINLVANLIFTPIQFGMRNLPLASVDILIVWATIIWAAVAIWKHYRWVAVAQVPYIIWVSIATVLQLSIAATNWGRERRRRLLRLGLPRQEIEDSIRWRKLLGQIFHQFLVFFDVFKAVSEIRAAINNPHNWLYNARNF